MWYYLKRFLQLLGNKVLSRMAPRLLFFQYYNRIGLEFEEKKKKFKLHHRPLAEMLLVRSLNANQTKKLGLSTISQQNLNNHEVNALDVNDTQPFWDDRTVSSHYEYENDSGPDWDIIEMEAIHEG